ncbi:unnamed protein product [Schistosoma margrebowiei]|uniref:Uncharacterized protein n=1 Tax=Schistosoma margrebowiei TaxID=48269 RepID=A0A183N4V8_9TREM|nr:unnamed protein product [Schistosoma margrebowiei]
MRSCTNPITIDGENLEDVKTFTYLGSIIDQQGGSDADVKARIGKARAAYLQLRNVWNSKQLSTNTKVRIFNTNVKTVLLSIGRTLLATTYCGREQTRSQRRKKSGRSAGSEESTRLRHKTSPHKGSTRPKEEGKTKEHITPGNGDRHEKNEQELDGTRKEGSGQSGLENSCQRPMLHWE